MSRAYGPAMHRPFVAKLPKTLSLVLHTGESHWFDMARFMSQGANTAELYRMGFWPDTEAKALLKDIPYTRGYPNPWNFEWKPWLPAEPVFVPDATHPRTNDTFVPEMYHFYDHDYPFSVGYANNEHSYYDPLRTTGYQRGWRWFYYIVQFPILGVIKPDLARWRGFNYVAGGVTGIDCFLIRLTSHVGTEEGTAPEPPREQHSNTCKVTITIEQGSAHGGAFDQEHVFTT